MLLSPSPAMSLLHSWMLYRAVGHFLLLLDCGLDFFSFNVEKVRCFISVRKDDKRTRQMYIICMKEKRNHIKMLSRQKVDVKDEKTDTVEIKKNTVTWNTSGKNGFRKSCLWYFTCKILRDKNCFFTFLFCKKVEILNVFKLFAMDKNSAFQKAQILLSLMI